MNKEAIEIKFDLDTGKVKAEAFGYNGEACSLDLNAMLTSIEVETRRRKTPDRNQTVVRNQRT